MIQSWRVAEVLDHITKPHTFLATAFRYSILDKASYGTGFFSYSLFDMLGSAQQTMSTPTVERRCNCPSARIIDSVGLYPFRPVGLDTLRRTGT